MALSAKKPPAEFTIKNLKNTKTQKILVGVMTEQTNMTRKN